MLHYLIGYAACVTGGALAAFLAARVIDRRILPVVFIVATIAAMAVSHLVSLQAQPGVQGHERNAQTFALAYGVLAVAVGSVSWLLFKRQRTAILAAVALSVAFVAASPVLGLFLGLVVAGLVI